MMTIRIYDGGGSTSDSNSRPAGICTSVEAKGDAALKPDRKREREKEMRALNVRLRAKIEIDFRCLFSYTRHTHGPRTPNECVLFSLFERL